ncbi:MAG: electron transport complex subunit RsxC [Lachnospiraceae bacterium]|nr:electron transport complex subunit RsxC [Lachnospiraceae bacterium]
MSKFTFTGGIHPFDGKSLSKDKPIVDILPKDELVYPLSQHIGAPAKAVVAVGETVKRGQMIAEAGGFVSAPIYASVSGTVTGIAPHRIVTGDMVESIIIKNDHEYIEVEYDPADPDELSKEEIIARIQKGGVVGMGGAGFPTHVKLSPKKPETIDYVIANCAECEPYLTSDYRRMVEEPEKLVEGLKIILRLFDNARGILAVEDNKPDVIDKLKKLTKDESRILVKALKTKYPQGSERQLIYATTKRAINSSMLPADAGCVVDNVDTIVAIYNAVKNGIPLMERIVTITGDCIKNPVNFRVHIGQSYRELIEEAGGFRTQPAKIVSGGPMMGFALFDLDVPTTKTASACLCLSEDEVSEAKSTNCINCGKCLEVCPGRVMPRKLMDLAVKGDLEGFEKLGGMECCECGCCSYICPAKRQLTQSIKSARKIVLANRRKAK